MRLYFLDTSALVKRYVPEKGTWWIRETINPDSDSLVFVSRITEVEFVSAVIRRTRNQDLRPTQASQILALFEFDLKTSLKICEIHQDVLTTSVRLVKKYALRAYDALQLASAYEIHRRSSGSVFSLVSSDIELNIAAEAEGLRVEDPETKE